VPASTSQNPRRIPFAFRRRLPRRACCLHVPQLSPWSADADPLRLASPARLKEPEPRVTDLWHSLSLRGHGSPAPADSPLPPPAIRLRVTRVGGFTHEVSVGRTMGPVKGHRSNGAECLKRYRSVPGAPGSRHRKLRARVWKILVCRLHTPSPSVRSSSASVAGAPHSKRRCPFG
jgi:hypothetical protein